VQREKAVQAVAQILAIRRKLADWQVDLTQAVVASHDAISRGCTLCKEECNELLRSCDYP